MSSSSSETARASISNVASVADALSEALAATYRLVLKSHMYHWNVTGPHFLTVHELTEAQYTDMFAAADVLAERIRALGKPAAIEPAHLAARSEGRDADVSLSAEEMLRDLLSDHERLAARMRALVGTAEAAEDPVTADLATTRADFHEKAAWMLRATAG
ncbi:Dps family protein [Sulfitobacter aestuarii]|uniref:Dps family protein n=1 Tax=Sulfitobacter aestuarii TaxID=2161676 RepID=A0ABW5UA72_9RHOB